LDDPARAKFHERTEAKRIAADDRRLRTEHREAERQRRLLAYQALIVVLGDIDRAATWQTATDEETDALIARFLQLHADVLLIGTDSVCEALSAVSDALNVIGVDMARLNDYILGSAAHKHVPPPTESIGMRSKTRKVGSWAMHDDVRRGYEDGA
jgi:hypothetical protein